MNASLALGAIWIIHSIHKLQFARKFPIHLYKLKSKKQLWQHLCRDEWITNVVLEQCITPIEERMVSEDVILLSPQSITNDNLFIFFIEEQPFVVLQMQDTFFVALVITSNISCFDLKKKTVYHLMNQQSCEELFQQLPIEFIFSFYFLQEFHSAYLQSNANIDLLHQYIAMALPFGQPLETNYQMITSQLQKSFHTKLQFLDKKRIYPWRINTKLPTTTITTKSNNTSINDTKIILREYIQSVQYDKPNQNDYWITNGTVLMQCNNESIESMDFSLEQVLQPSFHFCCQCDSTTFSQLTNNNNGKLKCIPLLYQLFSLAHYSFFLKKLPIRGFYQMKHINATQLQLLLQLKLEATVNNEFEYCDILIEFPNRIVQQCKLNPSIGTVVMSTTDKSCVIWKIGNKFKQLECTMPGAIHFVVANSASSNDSFFEQNNVVVKIQYKIINYLVSDAQFVLHSNVPNVSIKREVIGYGVIWNSRGETIGLQNQFLNPPTKS